MSDESLVERVKKAASLLEDIERDFEGDPIFGLYEPTIISARNRLSKISEKESRRLELESRPVGVWERKEYKGFSKGDRPRAISSTIARYLAEQFKFNQFTLEDTYPLDEKFRSDVPFSYSWTWNTVSGSVTNLYNRGLLERTGYKPNFSYRFVEEALPELSTIPVIPSLRR